MKMQALSSTTDVQGMSDSCDVMTNCRKRSCGIACLERDDGETDRQEQASHVGINPQVL
jgi:hypothetical protein